MKQIFLLCACLLVLRVSPAMAQVADPDIVVVRVSEYINTVELAISRGTGKTEYVQFKNGMNQKALMASSEGYYNALLKLYQQGYLLQGTFTSAASPNVSNTTLLFVKAPKP
jgi:hypothetical protein